ncbi:MAG: hypothetical protein ACI4E0_08175 [Blautia sp.]
MKRKYSKPVLFVESFQLNAAVAGDCTGGYTTGHGDNNCGYGDGSAEGFKYQFFNEWNCATDVVGAGPDAGDPASDNDTICYHGPYSQGVVFMAS